MSQVTQQALPPRTEPSAPIVQARGIVKQFQMGESTVEVLRGANLAVRRGEFVAIEGRSGSGKSTLLHILGGLDAADAGQVEFEREDIGELARKAALERERFKGHEKSLRWLGPILSVGHFLAAIAHFVYFAFSLAFGARADKRLAHLRNCHFGFVFQFYHLLPELNVIENTLLGAMIENSWFGYRARQAELRKKAGSILEELGLAHRLHHRPTQLSGGERQRVAIARALMNDPKILFADEPTGNLDTETGQQIMGVFERLHRERGQTIVMVTHDRSLARRADRVLVLKGGKLEAATTTTAAAAGE